LDWDDACAAAGIRSAVRGVYRSRLSRRDTGYAKLKIEVGAETGEGADHARVGATVLQPGEDPIEITFMLERAPRGWLMYDVVVDDIGMVENYRAQFDRVIHTRGPSRLEAELRIKQAKLDAMLGE
jgi:phospholipid transport system substrate-binding protein